MPPAAVPVSELGHAHPGSFWDLEPTPELMWPLSVGVYDAMRTQDAQVGSVLRAITLPVMHTRWEIDGSGCDEAVTRLIAEDLGLPIKGEQKPKRMPRTRDRFSWTEHLRLALLMLAFGHSFFEQVYRIDEEGRARLRKLGPRLPRTISEIKVAEDGGLQAIVQSVTSNPQGGYADKTIPVSRLVAYVNEREGGNWLGRSLLRSAYKNWLIKDRLLRVQAQTVERNGMGIPLYTGAEREQASDLQNGMKIATSYRSGETAGTAIPNGAKLELLGVQGELPDADKPIRYHDEQIARAVLAHFLNLGTQTGSWALGTTFADFFIMSLKSVAATVADVASQHIVEDLVDLNFGEAEPAPRVVFEDIGAEQTATAQAIKFLVDSGVVFPDKDLEAAVRQSYGLPPAGSPRPQPQEQQQPAAKPSEGDEGDDEESEDADSDD